MNGKLAPLRRPRVFCGEAFPWPPISELRDGAEVVGCYLIRERRRGEARTGKAYLDLRLGDRSGTINAKVWDDVDRLEGLSPPEAIVGVRGRVEMYQGKVQLIVRLLEPLEVDDADLELFLPSTRRDRVELERELDAWITSVADRPLNALLERCLGRQSALGRAFRLHPAAKSNHHACIGGLLEHSVSVAGACHRLAEHYAAQGAAVDRDLLMTGALLHDVGKVRELNAGGGFAYTHEGQLLGHILLGLQIVAREAEAVPGLSAERLLLVQHLIASHQGRLEWASPKIPQLLEGLILHYADDLDSKMNPAAALVAGAGEGEWTVYDRHLERALFRPRTEPDPDTPGDPKAPTAGAFDLFGS